MSWGLATPLRVHRAQRSGAGLSPTTVPVLWESFFSIDCQPHWTCLWNLSWDWLFLVTACGHVWNGGSGSESLTLAVSVKGFLLSEPEFYQQWLVPWGVQENSTESSYRLPALAMLFLWPVWSQQAPRAWLMKHVCVSGSKYDWSVSSRVEWTVCRNIQKSLIHLFFKARHLSYSKLLFS